MANTLVVAASLLFFFPMFDILNVPVVLVFPSVGSSGSHIFELSQIILIGNVFVYCVSVLNVQSSSSISEVVPVLVVVFVGLVSHWKHNIFFQFRDLDFQWGGLEDDSLGRNWGLTHVVVLSRSTALVPIPVPVVFESILALLSLFFLLGEGPVVDSVILGRIHITSEKRPVSVIPEIRGNVLCCEAHCENCET